MSKIIDLEIKNLSQKEKEELLYDLSAETRDWYDENTRGIRWNPNYKTFEEYAGEEYRHMYEEDLLATKEEYLDDDVSLKYFFKSYLPIKNSKVWHYWGNEVDELLKDYFEEFPDDFVKFQKSHKNSLYNETLKKHDFKDFDYKEVIKDLTQEQKDEIIVDISRLAIYFDVEDYRNYDVPDYIKKYDATPYITQIIDQDKKYIKRLANLYTKSWASRTTDEANENLASQDRFWKEFHELKINYGKEQFWEDVVETIQDKSEEVGNYMNNKYVLTVPNKYEHENWIRHKFFEDEDELILFGLNNKTFAPGILYRHNEILNPHHKVNEWIVTNHELELVQKDGLEQAQKFEKPKLKM
ncbi:hypothetical protein VQY16_01245 [Mesomycoplasma ovipneumoniae]